MPAPSPDSNGPEGSGSRSAGFLPPSLDEVLRRHLPGLIAFVRLRASRQLRAREATVDLVQSACHEVLRDMPEVAAFESEGGFRNWLYLAAERKIIDRARYHARDKRSPDREVPAADEDALAGLAFSGFGGLSGLPSPSQEAMAREQMEALEAALARLPEPQREIILLSRIVGLGHAEIAAQLGLSQGNVRVTLHRALAQLARGLESPEGHPRSLGPLPQ